MTNIPNYMSNDNKAPGRGGLLAVGVVSSVLGAACIVITLVAAVLLSKSVVDGDSELVWFEVIAATGTFAAMAAAFIAVGVGACKARRWVRPVALALAWTWLAVGVLSCIITMPSLFDPEYNSDPTT